MEWMFYRWLFLVMLKAKKGVHFTFVEPNNVTFQLNLILVWNQWCSITKKNKVFVLCFFLFTFVPQVIKPMSSMCESFGMYGFCKLNQVPDWYYAPLHQDCALWVTQVFTSEFDIFILPPWRSNNVILIEVSLSCIFIAI